MLQPDIAFLNHGSFGARRRETFDHQDDWRRRIEADPIEVLGRQSEKLLEEAKEPVGALLGMRASDFGFVTNATEGVNAVLRSLKFQAGDEILTTNHVYNAVRQAMKQTARLAGASWREIQVPFPVASSHQIENAVIDALTPRTRLVVIDHVTSPTALIFPVKQIVERCAGRGVEVLIDGAHAPGMIDLNVESLGAAYYTGNLHKWICAPMGCAFLWVRPDRQKEIHPSVVSHHLDEGFTKEFSWQGTRDISAWLSVGKAVKSLARFGWNEVKKHNHDLAVWARQMLCDAWQVPALAPESLLGSMATLDLPGRLPQISPAQRNDLMQQLYDEHKVEVPLFFLNDTLYLRISCQIYNRPEHYERLAKAISRLA